LGKAAGRKGKGEKEAGSSEGKTSFVTAEFRLHGRGKRDPRKKKKLTQKGKRKGVGVFKKKTRGKRVTGRASLGEPNWGKKKDDPCRDTVHPGGEGKKALASSRPKVGFVGREGGKIGKKDAKEKEGSLSLGGRRSKGVDPPARKLCGGEGDGGEPTGLESRILWREGKVT